MDKLLDSRVILIIIVLLVAILRLPGLGQLPPGITIDEAGQAYSAFSILQTGKDEWGDFLPLNPRGFGDYKPPVFMYLLVPSIALFGLNEFAVRLPSAIAGILTVWVVFLMVKSLFESEKLGLLASFFMAIAPWHVYYSRLGWESNIGLLFFCLGVWLYIKGLQKGLWFTFSALSFGISSLSYHSFKVLVPLMIFGLTIIFWKIFKKTNKNALIIAISVLIVFSAILGQGFIFSGAGRRAQDQSFFKEDNLSDLRKTQYDDKLPQPFGRVINNKYQFYLSKIADHYLAYYSTTFIFSPNRSDSSILNFPGKGMLYIWQLPLVLLGVWFLIRNRSKASAVIFLWLIIAPIPAALTQDYMHAGRAQAIFPVLTILSAIGLFFGFQLLKNSGQKKIAIITFSILIFVSLTLRIDNYLFHTFNKPLGGLKQGYREIVEFVEKNKDKYDKVIFTKSESEPQAFIAFYSKYDPDQFQEASQNWKHFETNGFKFLDMTDYKLGKYDFKNVDFNRDRNEKNTLIVGTPKEIPEFVTPKFKVSDITGKIIFIAIDTNEIPE